MREAGNGTVLVIGDVMTDIVVKPEGPLAHGADRRATIRTLPGGSGANQAAWLAHFGVPTRFAGRVGRQDHPRQVRLLEEAGVEARLAADAVLPTGTIVTLLSPDGERSFFTDRGANEGLSSADLPHALLDGVRLVHISAYALFNAGPRAAVLALRDEARRRGIAASIDPASHSFLRDAGPAAFLEWTEAVRLLFPNDAEAAALTGTREPDEQLDALTRSYYIVVIKQGRRGAAAGQSGGGRWSAAAPIVEAVDTSGAGDAFLAGFLSEWLAGRGVEAGLRRGVAAGSRAVTFLGGRPPSGTLSTTFTDF